MILRTSGHGLGMKMRCLLLQGLRWLRLAPLGLITGCSLFTPTPEQPMPLSWHGDPDSARQLVVLLPGIRGAPGDFQRHGFIAAAQSRIDAGDWALITPDAHWGYYSSQTLETRLLQDLFARWPDKPLTLVGISLGGLGSLLMAPLLEPRVEQLVLLAPYLGEAGDSLPPQGDDLQGEELALSRAWQYLRDPTRKTPVYMAWGRDDRFAPVYQQLLAGELGPLQHHSEAGGHRWPVWQSLWRSWLQRAFPES